MEQHLSRLLAQVEGIGKTEVMLTLKSSGKKIVEKDTQQSQSGTSSAAEGDDTGSWQNSSSESTVVSRESSGAESPYVTEELEPEVAGVLVIAQGAGDARVAAEITEAVEALFGVEAHKIKVMKME
jgi:stage III sporulation protein AG